MSIRQLGTHLRMEEGIWAQDGAKDTKTSVPKSTVNIVEVGGSSGTKKSNNKNSKPMLQTKRGRPSLVGDAMDPCLRGIVVLRRRIRQRMNKLVLLKTPVKLHTKM